MYVCKSIDRTVVSWFARIGYTQPLICNFVDCKPCTSVRRANPLPEPTVREEDFINDDSDDGPMPTWDDAFDWGRSPR